MSSISDSPRCAHGPFPNTRLSSLEEILIDLDQDASGVLTKLIEFIHPYVPFAISWIRARGLSQTDAELVAYEVTDPDRLRRRLRTFNRGKGRFRAWFKTMVHNAVKDRIGRHVRLFTGGSDNSERLAEAAWNAENTLQWRPEWADMAEELLRRAEEKVKLGTREPKVWESYELSKQGLSTMEVAKRLSLEPSHIHKNKSRVFRRIEQVLRELQSDHDRAGGGRHED
jgi:RNA polymerase sigma factor (sigma-70 family)